MLIPNRTFGDVLANLGAFALGVASYPVAVVLIALLVLLAVLGFQ